MNSAQIQNPRLNRALYFDYLAAQDSVSRIDRLRMLVKRTRHVLAKPTKP